MKYFFAILVWVSVTVPLFAQKPPLDTALFGKWPDVQNPIISNDGHYSSFFVKNETLGNNYLHVVANAEDWELKIRDGSSATFSSDGNRLFFSKPQDSLAIVDLRRHSIIYLSKIKSFSIPENGTGEWVTFLLDSPDNELIVRNLASGHVHKLYDVTSYQFNKDGQVLLVQHRKPDDSSHLQVLNWIDLNSWDSREIWSGVQSAAFVFDDSCKGLAFLAQDTSVPNGKYCLQYYHKENMHSHKVGDNLSDFEKKGYFLYARDPIFSSDGSKILFQFHRDLIKPNRTQAFYKNVNIWRYNDLKLPVEDTDILSIWAIALLNQDRVIQITQEGEELESEKSFDKYLIALRPSATLDFLNRKSDEPFHLVSVKDGSRDLLIEKGDIQSCFISPDERFVVWFNPDSLNYFSYDISSRTIKNITRDIKVPLCDTVQLNVGNKYASYDIDSWDSKNEAVFIYDKYDVWKIDLRGQIAPINITNSYGRKHELVYGLMSYGPDLVGIKQTLINNHLLLVAYDPKNKFNGFWEIPMKDNQDPVKIVMNPVSYFIPRTGSIGNIEKATGMEPIKAKNADAFLVQRMSSEEFPNIYFSSDLKSFKQLSSLHPERPYNWLKAELLHWQMPDGRMAQGVLYKPEDFDSTKKYPLIFDYYAKRSDNLNLYIEPDFSFARINIPYFVSNGYLVFVPDIYYKQGHNGMSVLKTVESAAHYLSRLSFIDSSKMGLQGHSFGGWETNFLITHSKLFRAACEGSGVSDQVSAYDQLNFGGGNRQMFYEVDQQGSPYGFGVTPWTHPELYIENSPVFKVEDVSTPLLMMHGDKDGSVPYDQAIEMFLALRRAGKNVWLLQYKDAGHMLMGDDNRDYTIRMMEFFDYYLKDRPMPGWMGDK